MGNPKSYKTKQRDVILAALRALPQPHISAEDLAALLRQNGEDVGLATVYRNLDKLVQGGTVLKYALPGGGAACYQYLPEDTDAISHCHLICTACGQVQHLHCNEIDEFAQHLADGHCFSLDRQRTVLYGRCAACAGASLTAAPVPCTHHTKETP